MIDKHIHHTFWCFNENSGDTGGLVYDDFGKWDEEKYEFVKPALWQTEGGQFIGLDHQIKLGQAGNGISLSDYYGGGASSQPRPTTPPATTATEPASTTAPETVTTAAPTETTVTTVPATQPTTAAETATAAETTSGSSGMTTPGDANLDGKVTVSDCVAVLQYIANQSKYPIEPQGLVNADIDGQEGISGGDAIMIQKIDAGLVTF